MTRRPLAIPGALALVVLAHEAALRALAKSDLPSVLFAPGAHSPVLYLVLSVGFVGLRLVVYWLVPFVAAAWVATRIIGLLSAAAGRRAWVDASHNRASQWQTTAPSYPADLPRASRQGSNR